MEDFNFKFNMSGDIISKTYIWRAAIREVKTELLKNGFRNITFENYLNMDKAITLIEDGKYEVTEKVSVVNVGSEFETKEFTAIVNIVGQGNLSCEVESVSITES